MGRPRLEHSTAKLLQSEEIVELKPPADYGFSGTVKCYAVESAKIKMLKDLGYTVVEREKAEA